MARQNKNTVPPSAPKLEAVILGAMMLESTAYFRIISQQPLSTADFYVDNHAAIFEAIQTIASVGGKIDMMTVAQQLIKNGTLEGIGGVYALSEITQTVASTANIEHHALLLKQISMKRELLRIGAEAQRLAFDPTADVIESVESVQKSVMGVTDKLTKSEDNINDILAEIDESALNGDSETFSAISTGVTDLDKNLCGGIEKDDYFVIGADSGGGKTALMMCIILSFLEHNKRAAVFSYEMKTKKLLIRLIAAKAEIKGENIKTGGLSQDEYLRYQLAREWLNEKIEKGLLKIFDCSGMTIETLRAKCVAAHYQTPLDGVFIDYMQLIANKKNFRDGDEAATHNARELMNIKNYLNVPFIVLSQLRKNKPKGRPTAFDLLGAQALQNCGSKILLIHRPEVEGVLEFEDGSSSIGKADIYIDKNREGRTACERVLYLGECFKFCNESNYFYPNTQSDNGENESQLPF